MRPRQTVDNAQKNASPHLWPRLLHAGALEQGLAVALDEKQSHYIANVMRKSPGHMVRLFNARSGDWGCRIELAGKKQVLVRAETLLKPPLAGTCRRLILLASLIKKDPYDLLLVKATELGVTDIQPVLSERTVVRALNESRAASLLTEAAEQCERLSVPVLHTLLPLQAAIGKWVPHAPIFACIESHDSGDLIRDAIVNRDDAALLTGPEGGFTDGEVEWLQAQDHIRPVSLGPRIMKAETAALAALAIMGPEGGG